MANYAKNKIVGIAQIKIPVSKKTHPFNFIGWPK